MLALTVIALGSLSERYWRDAAAEYQKRMAAFYKFSLIELPEVKLQQSSPALIAQALEKEADAILAKIPPRSRIYALCIEGNTSSSEKLAAELAEISMEASQVVFIIGSSHGLSERVKSAAHRRLSISPMTFPHQLARVMLCEQLYRAGSIISGGKYHK